MRDFAPFVPTRTGHAAMDELDRVPWAELQHAYGRGVVQQHDVRAMLAKFGVADPLAVEVGIYHCYGIICHQGTIYEATAHAVPFLAAFAAGDVWTGWVRQVMVLLGHIAISSSFATESGTFSGSYGEDVGDDTRASLRACEPSFATIAEDAPALAGLARAIVACAKADPPERSHLDAIAEFIAVLELVEDGEPPRLGNETAEEEWVAHPKFGVGLVVRRQDDKTTVRFADGTDRTIANRFLSEAEKPEPGAN